MDIEEILIDNDYVKFEKMFNDAIIGITKDSRLIYDYDKMVDCLMKEEKVGIEDASDIIDYNYSYGGYPQPVIMYKVIKEINDEEIGN
jgi:hypothetical protein